MDKYTDHPVVKVWLFLTIPIWGPIVFVYETINYGFSL